MRLLEKLSNGEAIAENALLWAFQTGFKDGEGRLFESHLADERVDGQEALRSELKCLHWSSIRARVMTQCDQLGGISIDASSEYNDQGSNYLSLSSVTLQLRGGDVLDIGSEWDELESSEAYEEYRRECPADTAGETDDMAGFREWIAGKIGFCGNDIDEWMGLVFEYARWFMHNGDGQWLK